MKRRLMIHLATLFLGAIALWSAGCRRDATETTKSMDLDGFMPVYNRYIANWIKNQKQATEREIAKTESDLAAVGDPGRSFHWNCCQSRLNALYLYPEFLPQD